MSRSATAILLRKALAGSDKVFLLVDGFGSFFTVVASFLMTGLGGMGGLLAGVSFLMIFLSKFSRGLSTIASSSSGAPTPVDAGAPPVRMRLVNQICSRARGWTNLTAVVGGILGFLKIKCFSAATRPALFNKALCVICPL